jgi:hypothetical protein
VAQITILSLVAFIAKNVHRSWSLDDAPRQTADLHRREMRNRLIAIKTKLAFDGL